MTLRCGLVGLPNVGKSTLFNALVHANVPAEGYPFCTVEPNKGEAVIPDARLTRLAEILQPEKVIPTHLHVVDIAGLIEGSSRGEGLGNRFLSHIRDVDLILHVVRRFESTSIPHPFDTVNPLRDYEVIRTELALKDLETLTRHRKKIDQQIKRGDKRGAKELKSLTALIDQLEAGNLHPLLPKEGTVDRDLVILTTKPELVIFNTTEGEDDAPPADLLGILDEFVVRHVSVSAEWEAELTALPPEESATFREELGLSGNPIARITREAARLLRLITFYTIAHDILQAWSVPEETTLYEAAGLIHTEIQEGFIKAEVITAEDLLRLRSESACRNGGAMRIEGRETPVKDGDVVTYKFRG